MLEFLLPFIGALVGGVITALIAHRLGLQKLRKERSYDFSERELLKKRDALAKFLGIPTRNVGSAMARVASTNPDTAINDFAQLDDQLPLLHDSAIEILPLFHGNDLVETALTWLANLPQIALSVRDSKDPYWPVHQFQDSKSVLEDELTRLETELAALYAPKPQWWKFWQRSVDKPAP